MKIQTAKDTGNGRLITAQEADMMDEEDGWRHRLGCVYCGCALTFVHTSSASRAHFRTKGYAQHSLTCQNNYDREERRYQYRVGAVQDGRIAPKAVSTRLDQMFKELRHAQASDKMEAIAGKSKRTKSQRTTKNTQNKTVTKINVSVDPNVPVVESQAAQRVRLPHRVVSAIDHAYINQVVIIGGYLSDVVLGRASDPQATLTMTWMEKTLPLRVRPDAFQHQIGMFNRFLTLAQRMQQRTKPVLIAAAALIQVSTQGTLEAVLMNESDLKLNGELLSVFVTRCVTSED